MGVLLLQLQIRTLACPIAEYMHWVISMKGGDIKKQQPKRGYLPTLKKAGNGYWEQLVLCMLIGNRFHFVITSRSARSTRTAGPKIALRFPRLSVCLFVCPHLSRAQYITSYVTMPQNGVISLFTGLYHC